MSLSLALGEKTVANSNSTKDVSLLYFGPHWTTAEPGGGWFIEAPVPLPLVPRLPILTRKQQAVGCGQGITKVARSQKFRVCRIETRKSYWGGLFI